MKRKALLIAILPAIILYACEDLFKEIVTVDTEYIEMDFSVEASDLKYFQIFSEEVFANEIDNTIQHAGISEKSLQSVHLKKAEVSITSQGAYTNFNLLKFIEITVYMDSLGEEKIAILEPIPQGVSTINLTPASENLLPYFRGDSLILTAQGYLLERIYENIDLHARIKIEIKGEI